MRNPPTRLGVKSFDQLGFADLSVVRRETRASKSLAQINQRIDWSSLGSILVQVRDPKIGRKGFPPLLMVKALLLAQWYNLSDPALEDAISDRLSFREFIGLPLDEPAPDETAFVRFRRDLRRLDLEKALFDEVLRQLDDKGLILRTGTLMDATIIEASVSRPNFEKGQINEADKDAEFTVKNGKSHYGYKLHIGLDQGSGIIRQQMTSGASLHDSQAIYELISGDERQVCADKAYESKELSDKLKEQKIKDRIMLKKPKGRKETTWRKYWNKALSAIRFEVEQPFGIGKTCFGLARTRFRGIDAVSSNNNLFCIAYNLKRSLGRVA